MASTTNAPRRESARIPDLTVGDVAAILNLHKRTIERWVVAGKIDHYRLPNGDIRFRPSDIEKLRGGELERV